MTTVIANARKPLSDADLKASAPSIFTAKAHKSRSERYVHVPTIEVVHVLRKAGFLPVQAFQSRIHKEAGVRGPYAKHLIRFRERKFIDKLPKLDEAIPDIILTNSHNGKCAFKLEAGLYRLVCENGMVIQSDDFGSIKLSHCGQIATKVKEGAQIMTKHVPEILRVTKEWDRIKLSPTKRMNFAREALKLRFPKNSPITTAQALEVHRNEDEAPTLWRTFNVLQENLLKGGLRGQTASGRATTTKMVTSVNNSLHYNRGLWLLAEKVAERA